MFPPVTILTSGVGLGIYVPALLIERRLRREGCAAAVEVLEDYYTPAHQASHLRHKDAHHQSFALAQIAHRMARDVQACMDAGRVDRLLARWAVEERTRFVVWAGFWLPILERYRAATGRAIDVDHCRIDAEVSASFRIYGEMPSDAREIWLWNWSDKRIHHEIPVGDAPPIPFAARDDRLVVHGGGWGIGTYASRAAELPRTRYALDIVVDKAAEAIDADAGDRCYALDPGWRPWHRDAQGRLEFPPMAQVVDPDAVDYRRNDDYHVFHDTIRGAKAIVSKPGGGTLIDSLASATPVILLEPYGYAEISNGRIWEHLGYGISFDMWRDSGYDAGVLERLHDNLMRRMPGIDYPRLCAERIRESADEAL